MHVQEIKSNSASQFSSAMFVATKINMYLCYVCVWEREREKDKANRNGNVYLFVCFATYLVIFRQFKSYSFSKFSNSNWTLWSSKKLNEKRRT